MLLQGPRPEELLSLAWPSVDLETGIVRILKGKSDGARRELRLRSESREIMARRRRESAGPWVFPSPKTQGAHLSKLNNPHGDVLETTGLAFVIYDFRHTFATRAANAGMPLGTLAAILGHGRGNLRSVMKYVHVSKEAMAEETLKLDSEIDGHKSGINTPLKGAKPGHSEASLGKRLN
jgi:integrase